MENIDKILILLYKKVSPQSVINEHIHWDNFDKTTFRNIFEAYDFSRNGNEIDNLFNYLITICSGDSFSDKLFISRKLNVFEVLVYSANKFIDITNNEIRCHYLMLPQWRNITVELSEDLLVTAFLAKKISSISMMNRGFAWPRIISHDNEHLHAVMARKISENHSHINGAAPIFHVSWLNLMNNLTDSRFSKNLESYDAQRRYMNIKYSSEYEELSFLHRHYQAVLIRLLLFSKLSEKRISIGRYEVSLQSVWLQIKFPELFSKTVHWKLHQTQISDIKSRLAGQETCDYKDFVGYVLENYIENEMLIQSPAWNFFAHNFLGQLCIKVKDIERILDEHIDANVSHLLETVLKSGDFYVPLECLEELFVNHSEYISLWEQMTLENVHALLKEPYRIESMSGTIQMIIDGLRRESENESSCAFGAIDYALGVLRMDKTREEDWNFIFSGERWLMYSMFYNYSLNHTLSSLYFDLFYAYLLIKESIRSELVVSNKAVGFMNFQQYQNRKVDFIPDNIYSDIFLKSIAYDYSDVKNIKHMELRFPPALDERQNLDNIFLADKTMGVLDADKKEENAVRERFFYTLHFLKKSENIEKPIDYFRCRHHIYRVQLMKQAYAIAAMRERYPVIGKRVFGIDAASNEIGCRPEVFASVFRYLKQHRCKYMTSDGPEYLPQLRATFHVGEDFLDVADGLRAIEEAVFFLELDNGDRLGHALALGIDVKEWYEKKNYTVILPKQDYLDNLVWVYRKLSEYNISGYENLKIWIYGQFTVVFQQLYGKDSQKADLHNYYNAWRLRGDDPSLYEDGQFNPGKIENWRQFYLLNELNISESEFRRIPEITKLYWQYHFDEHCKVVGKLTTEYTVSKTYANAVAEIQHKMQFDIASKGIAIETNPSSNYHIGTFRNYNRHPILKFYNKGLVHDEQEIQNCAQIPVSINTDDQGVFGTSLENEYALLASASEAATDDFDEKLYKPADIYEWLDHIRIMGNDQSFAEIYRRKHE